MDFNLLVRFFLLLFCLEGFPLPGGEACLPLRSLAAQVTSLLWSCNMMLYLRRHPVTDHIKRMVPAPSAKLKDPTQAREQRFPCLQNSRQRCQSSELPLPICRGSRETHEWRAVLTEKIRHTNSSLRMSCHTALKTVHSRKGLPLHRIVLVAIPPAGSAL